MLDVILTQPQSDTIVLQPPGSSQGQTATQNEGPRSLATYVAQHTDMHLDPVRIYQHPPATLTGNLAAESILAANASAHIYAIDCNDLTKTMEKLSSFAEQVVSRLIRSLGLRLSDNSPFDWQPGPELLALYRQCFGPNWPDTSVKLYKQKLTSTSDVLTAILSAHLHQRVLHDSKGLSDYLAINLKSGELFSRLQVVSGSTGE